MIKGSFGADILTAWNIDLEKNKGRLMLSDRVMIQKDSTDTVSVSNEIAYDNSAKTTSNNLSFTVGAGANRVLLVFTISLSDTVTAVSYGGQSLSVVKKTTFPGSGRDGMTCWILVNPPSGANTVALTGTFVAYVPISYSGALQTGQPDASAVNNQDTSSTSITGTLTTINNNCWAVIGEVDSSGGESAGAGTTQRQVDTGIAYFVGDSNTFINPAGSKSLVVGYNSGTKNTAIIVSIAPAIVPVALGFDVPLCFVYFNADARTWVLTDNKLLKTNTSGSVPAYDFITDPLSNSITDGLDMLTYTLPTGVSRLLVSRESFIAKLDASDISGSGWETTWMSVNGGPMAQLSNLIIIGAQNTISTIDNNDILVSGRLIFDAAYFCNLLYSAGDLVWIGWISISSKNISYPEGNFEAITYEKGAISYWDGGNEVINETYFLESAPLSGFIVNGVPYFILQNGQIMVYSSNGFVEVQEFPNFEEGINLGHLSIKRHGCVVNGTLVYINITAPLYSKRMRSGIWVFDTISKNLYPYGGIGQYKLSATIGINVIGSSNVTGSGVTISLTPTVTNAYGILFATNDTGSTRNLSTSTTLTIARQGNGTHFWFGDTNNAAVSAGAHSLSASAFGSTDINAVGLFLIPTFGATALYDNSDSTGDLSGTPTGGTLSFTIGAALNRIALVAAIAGGTNADTASQPTITLNGVNMTLYNSYPSVNNAGVIYLFYMYNPPTGTQNVVWAQGSTKSTHFCVTAVTYSGISSLGPDQDFGQQISSESGGLFLTKDIQNRLLIGSNIFTAYSGTVKSVIATLKNSINSRGYFVTPLIQTQDIEEYWYNMWVKFPAFYNAGNMIIGKWRVQPELLDQYFNPVQAIVTWTSINTFTGVLPVGISIGNEVEIMAGDNSGCVFHIQTLSTIPDGTTVITVTVDENASYLSSSASLARFDNWNKITGTDIKMSQSGQSLGLAGGNSVTSQSPYVQFKIELRGLNVGLDQLTTDEKVQIPTNL